MRFVLRPGGNPLFQSFLFLFAQGKLRLGRRHEIVRVTRKNPAHEFAGLWMVRLDGDLAGFGGLQSFFPNIEAQFGFAGFFIGTMTFETVAGQDRPDIAKEFDFLILCGGGAREKTDAEKNGSEAECFGWSHRGYFSSHRHKNLTSPRDDFFRITAKYLSGM
jgi:hypothetical protein